MLLLAANPMGSTTLSEQTLTPQNAFPLVGSLEDTAAIKAVALALLQHAEVGLLTLAQQEDEQRLCRLAINLFTAYPKDTTREEIGRLKEIALLSWGSPIAACIDYLCSAARTPAIAESAIRSAGTALFHASEVSGKGSQAVSLFRGMMAQSIAPLSEAELAA